MRIFLTINFTKIFVLQVNEYKFVTERYKLAFTLWNRIIGDIQSYKARDYKIQIDGLLQPGEKGNCVSMLLLFGRVPSWFSWPCKYLSYHIGPVICQRRLEARRPLPNHVAAGNNHTICHSNEVFVIDKCFVIRHDFDVLPSNESPVTLDVQAYLINVFSFIAWQTYSGHQLVLKVAIFTAHDNDSCINIVRTPGLSYDIKQHVNAYVSSCKPSKSHRVYSIATGKIDSQLHCQANQVTCDDGTCVSQNSVCLSYNDCNTILCSCQSVGRTITDKHFCRHFCSPSNCTCSEHYFQCTSGGCTHMSSVCDGINDCRDSSDEICIITLTVPETDKINSKGLLTDTFLCMGFLCHSGQCIAYKHVDDLMPDCLGGKAEDEPLYLMLRYNNTNYSCNDHTQIPCVTGLPVCFSFEQLCLFDYDQDGNTQWCRNGAHLADCSFMNCTNSYKCPESYCIPFHRVCDGYPDCTHGEDEEHCDEYRCIGLLRCIGTKICVHPKHVCDRDRNCPGGEDEELCDIAFCPHDCNCLSYSITCTIKISNRIPKMPSKVVKHIAIVYSHMSHPDYYNIRDQRELVLLNLTGNHVKDICFTYQDESRFYESLVVLDLSHNEINHLGHTCFETLRALKILFLAYNPLHELHRNSLSSVSVLYISLQSSKIKSLYGDSLSRTNKKYLDITDISLEYVDNFAKEILSRYYDLKFNDNRLCCIFIRNKKCLDKTVVLGPCYTLLPEWFIGYIILPTGVAVVTTNIYALYANCRLTKGSHFTKITTFLISIDVILAFYLPIIGAADLYYKSHFILAVQRWQRGIACRLMKNLSTIAAVLSPFYSGLIIFFTSHAITSLEFNISDQWCIVIFTQITMLVATICFSASLTVTDMFLNDYRKSNGYLCHMMSDLNFTSKYDILFVSIFSLFMLSMITWITISAYKLILHIRKTTQEVGRFSNKKLNSSHANDGVYKFMIVVIVMKFVTYLPYPLLQIIRLLVNNVSEKISISIMLSFIILECSLNPIMFVLRPLLVQKTRPTVSK